MRLLHADRESVFVVAGEWDVVVLSVSGAVGAIVSGWGPTMNVLIRATVRRTYHRCRKLEHNRLYIIAVEFSTDLAVNPRQSAKMWTADCGIDLPGCLNPVQRIIR